MTNYYEFEPGDFGRPFITDGEHMAICLDCEFGANRASSPGSAQLCANHQAALAAERRRFRRAYGPHQVGGHLGALGR